MTYSIRLSIAAQAMLVEISDRRIRQKIADKINQLKLNPEMQGKPLSGELSQYRSIRAAAQRYRIIYQVIRGQVVVLVIAIGIRKDQDRSDIYQRVKKLIRLKLL
ncbi:MAG: type II toxin-antitoxin system RelE family toxin [Elusimicrobiota bacterium]